MMVIHFFKISLVFILALGFDLFLLPAIPWLHLLIHCSLLSVIALTISERWYIALLSAIVAGLTFTLFSSVTGPGYIVSFMAAVGVSWFVSHKIVTTHSTISFISTIALGTIGYTITFIIIDLFLTLVNRQRIHADVVAVAISGLTRLLVHPIILVLFWRLFGKNQYHRLQATATKVY